LPLPTVTGNIHNPHSSISSFLRSVWIRLLLP
jgi:hypothetical protein